MKTAIAIFGYRRPNHLRQVINSLTTQSVPCQSPVYLFLDGPRRNENSEQVEACKEIGLEMKQKLPIRIVSSDKNQGLYNSITTGVTRILGEYERVIVLEDDIVTSPHFLEYMLEGLNCYAETDRVAAIHAYLPPIKETLPETFFLRGADCWGWGTWRDRWSLYRDDAKSMATEIRKAGLSKAFNLGGRVPNLDLLDACADGRSKSWAIRWHASCFLAERYTLHPGRSLVRNIGLDGSGEHCRPSKPLEAVMSESPIHIAIKAVEENPEIVRAFSRQVAKAPFPVRIYRRLWNAILRKVGNKGA